MPARKHNAACKPETVTSFTALATGKMLDLLEAQLGITRRNVVSLIQKYNAGPIDVSAGIAELQWRDLTVVQRERFAKVSTANSGIEFRVATAEMETDASETANAVEGSDYY